MKTIKDERYWELVDMKAAIVATKLLAALADDKSKKSIKEDLEFLAEQEKEIDKELATYKVGK